MAKTVRAMDRPTLTWSGQGVDLARIEAELLRLRQEAAVGAQPFAVRASVLNLVVYAASEGAARRAAQVVAGLAGQHPSRTLIAVARPSEAEPRIDAELAAHCHPAAGLEQQACCEEVVLKVRGRAARHLHSVIVPLLVPDLPVYVWWTADPPRDAHVFEEILESADRLIVDSSRFRPPLAGMAWLARLCVERPGCGLGDLTWARLTPWRQVLGQHCQRAPRPYLERVREAEILYARTEARTAPSGALLMLGWLAARYGWVGGPAGRGERFSLRSPEGEPVSVTIGPGEGCPGLAPGSLVSVVLRGAGQEGAATLSISRREDPLHLSVQAETEMMRDQSCVRTEAWDEGETLARELEWPSRDVDYEGALANALSLAGRGI